MHVSSFNKRLGETMETLRYKKYNGKVLLWGKVSYEDGTPAYGSIVILEGFCETSEKYPKCKDCKYNGRSYFLGISSTNECGEFSFIIHNRKLSYRLRVFDD